MPTRQGVLCLSHQRWSCAEQRARQLLSQCARERPVVFFEEPVFDASSPTLEVKNTDAGVTVATPHLAPNTPQNQAEAAQRRMIDRITRDLGDCPPVLWYYTPAALSFTDHLRSGAIVYDCTNEPALADGVSELAQRERSLLERADVVFTDGHNLGRHKRRTARHRTIHPFPSSGDLAHFVQAREELVDPVDQAELEGPRVGFFGVIDDRIDLRLLADLADARPELQFVMLGPVAKSIERRTLPRAANLHWLGGKPYAELPSYLAGWDVAMLPLACTDPTRLSASTRAAEYLAAGKPVVSTAIPDVIDPYGREGLVWIAEDAGEFADIIDDALASDRDARVAHIDAFLSDHSWQQTWQQMWGHIEQVANTRALVHAA